MKRSNIVQAIPDVPGRNGPYNTRSESPCKKGKDIVRKLRRADELAAEGKTGEEITAELEISAAKLYN